MQHRDVILNHRGFTDDDTGGMVKHDAGAHLCGGMNVYTQGYGDLILDELGYVPASKAGAELLFDVIATTYERNSVIVTTNLPFENWTEVLGNERLTGAALDRLTHRCHILETKGESYRLRESKQRRRNSR